MGKYTNLENPLIDDKIDEILNSLVNQIVGVFHPGSIILSGSFGRGEGSVLYQNNNVNIISDFEIGVISKKYHKRFLCRKIVQEINHDLDIDLTLNFYLPSRFTKNKTTNLSIRAQHLTIDQYELRYGSKLLYGKDYLSKMKDYSPKDIPTWEGIRLIFNRMAESLKYFFPDRNGSRELSLKKWICKTILACSDALLISIGKYHFLYRIRAKNFIDEYLAHFQELLAACVPEFPDLVAKSIKFKLGSAASYNEDLQKLWFQTKLICDITLRYLIRKDMGFQYLDYIDFQEKYLQHSNLRRKYYRGLLGTPLYQNLLCFAKIRRQTDLKFLRCLSLKMPLLHLLYSTIALLYFGLKRNNEVNREYLKKAQNDLRVIAQFSCPDDDSMAGWLKTRDYTVTLWSAVCN